MSLIYLQTLVLALIQGVSEFIPVSSSAHLIIFSNLITNYSSSVLMDTSLHLGSLIAITHYFWKDLLDFTENGTLEPEELIAGSAPNTPVYEWECKYCAYSPICDTPFR